MDLANSTAGKVITWPVPVDEERHTKAHCYDLRSLPYGLPHFFVLTSIVLVAGYYRHGSVSSLSFSCTNIVTLSLVSLLIVTLSLVLSLIVLSST